VGRDVGWNSARHPPLSRSDGPPSLSTQEIHAKLLARYGTRKCATDPLVSGSPVNRSHTAFERVQQQDFQGGASASSHGARKPDAIVTGGVTHTRLIGLLIDDMISEL
jgi:hypothetical protein